MASFGARRAAVDTMNTSVPQDALYYEIGVTRVFGSADIGDHGLRSGWSGREDSHNWNDGEDATLKLWADTAPADACVLSVEGSPYTPQGVDVQHMTLFVNGCRLGYWKLSDNKGYTLQAQIEPEHWLKRDGGAVLNIVWHLPDSVKPHDVGDADDHRQLGFCFRSLVLEYASA